MRRTTQIAAALAGLGLAAGGGAYAGAIAYARPAVPTVTVKLKEFKVTLSPAKLPTGRVTLVATNTGAMRHALAVKGPGVHARTALLVPGKSARLSVTLKGGNYTLWCPVGTHAASGMKATVHVASAAGTGAGSGTSPLPTVLPPPGTTVPNPYG